MRKVITIWATLFLIGVAGAEVMPPLSVKTLSGESLVVPPDTATGPSLFVIGFSKKSRAQTSQWTRRLESADRKGEPPYQVAVLEDVPNFFRGLVLRAIRSDVPERLHKRFLIVSEKADVWKRLVNFLDPDDAYLLLVGSGGELIWRAGGRLTEESFRSLLQTLRAARPESSRP
jgi:hypothetical protein